MIGGRAGWPLDLCGSVPFACLGGSAEPAPARTFTTRPTPEGPTSFGTGLGPSRLVFGPMTWITWQTTTRQLLKHMRPLPAWPHLLLRGQGPTLCTGNVLDSPAMWHSQCCTAQTMGDVASAHPNRTAPVFVHNWVACAAEHLHEIQDNSQICGPDTWRH